MYDYVYLYRKKCDIDLYGENIVHWIYRMIFVCRVWVTTFCQMDGSKSLGLFCGSSKIQALRFLCCFCKDPSVGLLLFLHRS